MAPPFRTHQPRVLRESQPRRAQLQVEGVSILGGTTPKFDCELDTGEEIRIKYGHGPEVPAEAATTRLSSALGFGADDVTLVRALCGATAARWSRLSIMKAVEATRTEAAVRTRRRLQQATRISSGWRYERKFNARPIETDRLEGWAFFELDAVDPAKGGAPRAHVDALRLMAVFLAHWDNKSENQRLVCLDRDWPEGAPCAQPFLVLQDVGATFGPRKMDLEAWEADADLGGSRHAAACRCRHLPYDGATFAATVIIGEPAGAFSPTCCRSSPIAQLTDLFASARFDQKRATVLGIHAGRRVGARLQSEGGAPSATVHRALRRRRLHRLVSVPASIVAPAARSPESAARRLRSRPA